MVAAKKLNRIMNSRRPREPRILGRVVVTPRGARIIEIIYSHQPRATGSVEKTESVGNTRRRMSV